MASVMTGPVASVMAGMLRGQGARGGLDREQRPLEPDTRSAKVRPRKGLPMRGPNARATAPTGRGWDLKHLIGSGDRIALFALPFVIVGFLVQLVNPALLAVDGSSGVAPPVAVFLLTVGVLTWAWS